MVKPVLGVILAATFATGVWHRAKAFRAGDRFDRRNEGWGPLILIRMFGLMAAISLWRAFGGVVEDGPLRWVGVGITAAGSGLLIAMFRALGHNLTDTVETRAAAEFVRRGPYRWIRNPMYTGVLVFSVGLGVALESGFIALFGTATFAMLAIRTRQEEKFLLARFGERYENYMREVGRFFPRLMPSGGPEAAKSR